MFFRRCSVVAGLLFSTSYCFSCEPNRSNSKSSLIVDHCDKIYTLACFKLDAANWLDKFGTNSEFDIIPGVTLLQNPNSVKVYTSDIAAEVARDFPDQDSRVDQVFIRRLAAFLNNHSLKIGLWNIIQEESEVTGRKDKEKKGDGMGIILVAGAMMLGVLPALAMGGLTALAGKALITGLVSFVLSAIIGLKELTSPKQKTYIAQPVPVYAPPAQEGWEEYVGHSRSTSQDALPKVFTSNSSSS